MFTKFYLGILVAVFIAGGSCYLMFQLTFAERLTNYQTNALQGSLNLIQDTLPTLEEADQLAYLNIALKLLGASLISEQDLNIDSHQQAELLPLGAGARLLYSDEDQTTWQLNGQDGAPIFINFPVLSEQQFRAHTLLLISHLKGYAQNDDLRLVTPYSAYNIEIVQPSQMQLDPQQIQDLDNNRVVVSSLTQQSQSFSVLSPMGENKALKVGPIPEFEPLPFNTVLLMIAVTISIFIGVAYWIIYVLASRIKPIDSMVGAFGDGQLDARISLNGSDHFSSLATRINAMAERIKSLLETQRGIMQAVSHELRTPLARIRFKLAIIDEDLTDGQSEKTDPIRKDIVQVEQLIDEILEYHKLSQQSKLEAAKLEISEVFAEIKGNLESIYPNISFRFEIQNGELIVADKRALLRLMQNLCSNACKHAKSQIKVTINTVDDSGLITVEDDGNGISDQDKPKVFGAFYRADNQINRQQKGYGLGLSIVRQIVRLHQGKISLKDSNLGGALFEITMPQPSNTQALKDA